MERNEISLNQQMIDCLEELYFIAPYQELAGKFSDFNSLIFQMYNLELIKIYKNFPDNEVFELTIHDLEKEGDNYFFNISKKGLFYINSIG